MRVLMVSPFPPLRDGVGKYAAQEVAALRAAGDEVEVLSPLPCAAHYVEDLKHGLGPFRVRRHARRYDRVILQYQPSHYHAHRRGISRLLSDLGLLMLFRTTKNLTVVCHEIEYPSGWRGRPDFFIERMAWSRAPEVVFHTQREVEAMEQMLGARPKRVVIRAHGEYLRPHVNEDRSQARRRLGISDEDFVFLSIGFIQPHKGFDRAVRAFASVPSEHARLFVVGSIRTEVPENSEYLLRLRRMARADPRVFVIEAALSDEEFDRWIVASDLVVLPYREIWSSGVLERAKLLGRRAIVTNVGGLAEQGGPGDRVVGTDEELAVAMAEAAGGRPGSAPPGIIDVNQARSLMRKDAERIRLGRSGLDQGADPPELTSALRRLRGLSRVQTTVTPSPRPAIGPLLTLVKRFLRRALGWYVEPAMMQISEFQGYTAEALESLTAEVAQLRADLRRAQGRAEESGNEVESTDDPQTYERGPIEKADAGEES